MKHVVVSGGFDDLKSGGFRFFQEASRLGSVRVILWSDEMIRRETGDLPAFPYAERHYMVDALKYVDGVAQEADPFSPDSLPEPLIFPVDVWAVAEAEDSEAKRSFCAEKGIEYNLVREDTLSGFLSPPIPASTGKRKVVVTGCYDWFHSGHTRVERLVWMIIKSSHPTAATR